MSVPSPALVPAERRRSVRFGSTIPALIQRGGGLPLLPCTVLDVSQRGGRIRLEEPIALADHFTLLLTGNGRVRRDCRVIWRQNIYLGVAFSSRFDHTLG